MSIKLELVDNDYVVSAKTELALNSTEELLRDFLKSINEELLPGGTAHLVIEGSNMKPMSFDISNLGWTG